MQCFESEEWQRITVVILRLVAARLSFATPATRLHGGHGLQLRSSLKDPQFEVRKVAGGLWDAAVSVQIVFQTPLQKHLSLSKNEVPRQRTALLAAVLDAELRTMTGEEAHVTKLSVQIVGSGKGSCFAISHVDMV